MLASVSSFITSWNLSVASSMAALAFAPRVVARWSVARAEGSFVPTNFSASRSALRASIWLSSSSSRLCGMPASQAALYAPSAACTSVFGFCGGDYGGNAGPVPSITTSVAVCFFSQSRQVSRVIQFLLEHTTHCHSGRRSFLGFDAGSRSICSYLCSLRCRRRTTSVHS